MIFGDDAGDYLYMARGATAEDPRCTQVIAGDHKVVVDSPAIVIGLDPGRLVNLPRCLMSSKVYIVPGGIGDIAWVYAKLCSLDDEFTFVIGSSLFSGGRTDVTTRGVAFAKLLPKIQYVTMGMTDGASLYWMSKNLSLSNGKLPAPPSYLSFNYLLDRGIRLETILPHIKTTKHFEMLKPEWAEREADLFVARNEKAFSIYPSSKNYYGDQNLKLDHWFDLVTRLANLLSDHKVIIMGSLWDLNMIKPLYDCLCAVGFRDRVELVYDRDIAVTLAILRRSSFLLGCVSGLTIVAEYQRVPSIHLYPKELYTSLNLMGTWESEEMISQGLSLNLKIEDGANVLFEKMMEKFSPLHDTANKV